MKLTYKQLRSMTAAQMAATDWKKNQADILPGLITMPKLAWGYWITGRRLMAIWTAISLLIVVGVAIFTIPIIVTHLPEAYVRRRD